MNWRHAGRLCRAGMLAALCAALVACGGSEVVLEPSPEPTALPGTLNVAAPATRQALNADVAFFSNTADPDRKLRYRWEFGDGNTSTEAAPTHRYARGGSYSVRLTVRNEAGASVQASATVTVADLAVAQGLACSGADSGGWCWQNPRPQGNLILDQAWLDARTAWAVGQAGTILKTVDGGNTWQAQRSGLTVPLSHVVAVSEQVAWVGGDNGLVLVTADGGATWRQGSVGTYAAMQGLRAVDAQNAWISGYGDPWVTSDGGQTWRSIARPPGSYGNLLQTGPAQLWGAGSDNQGRSHLLRSNDAGVSWVSVALPAPSSPTLYQGLDAYRFADGLRGYAVVSEQGPLNGQYVYTRATYYTYDGGVSWRRVNPSPSQQSGNFNDLLIADDGSLFVRAGYEPKYEFSVDGGQTWAEMRLPDLAGGYLVSFTPTSARRAVIRSSVGATGRQYLSTDGGTTWQALAAPDGGNTSTVNSLWFFDTRQGIALTNEGGSLHTSDGGLTWTQRNQAPLPSYGWRKIEFSADGAVGWAISDFGDIYRSTDRGQTWLAPAPQTSARLGSTLDVHFIDASTGWALAQSYGGPVGQLFTSSNGGMSWLAVQGVQNLNGMRALRFADANHGAAVGSAGVAMLSSDAGQTWRARPTGSTRNLNDLAFADARTAIAVGEGGVILRSTDRGETWVRMPSPTASTLLHLRFVDAEVGHATGADGTVLVTRDGGLSWSDVSANTPFMLSASFFLDAQTGWVVGQGGTILVTISGGR